MSNDFPTYQPPRRYPNHLQMPGPQDPRPYEFQQTYVPNLAPGPSGLPALTVGIMAVVLFSLGLAVGGTGYVFGFLGFVLAMVGLPLGIVNLVRRKRARAGLAMPIAAIATNGSLVVMILIALIATAA